MIRRLIASAWDCATVPGRMGWGASPGPFNSTRGKGIWSISGIPAKI